MPVNDLFSALADERFVSLTTFRRTGVPVSTPVWISGDGDDLIVTAPKDSGKVKRIRNSGRVQIRACDRRGRVRDGAGVVSGVAAIFDDDTSREHLTSAFGKKYGLEYRVFMFIERLGKSGKRTRVLLRIARA